MDEKYRKIDPGLPEKLEGNLKTLEQVYETSFNELRKKDLRETVVKCGASLYSENKLVLKYFLKDIEIDTGDQKLYYHESRKEVDLFTAVIILHYVITADGEEIKGKWISYRELPDGMFYFRTIPGVLEPLRRKYETSFKGLMEKAAEYGGSRNNNPGNSIILYPFPYFPVMLVLEEISEEFDSDIRVLFDSSAFHYIKTDIIKLLIAGIVKLLLRG